MQIGYSTGTYSYSSNVFRYYYYSFTKDIKGGIVDDLAVSFSLATVDTSSTFFPLILFAVIVTISIASLALVTRMKFRPR